MTLEQLIGAGLTSRQVVGRVQAAWLLPRHRGVYAVGHIPRSRASRWHAAVLTVGAGSVLSHRSAAAHWGFVSGAVPTEVVVAPPANRRSRDGIVIHRARLAAAHVTRKDGIPVTTPVRTLLDLASVLRLPALGRAFEEAQVQLGLLPAVIAAELACRRGHRGTGRIRALLADAVDPTDVRSILELRFLRMCARYGVPRPVVNEQVDAWTPDFRWPEEAVVVETDGARFHRTRAKRERDARKDAELTALGYTVVRLSWADVTDEPAATAAQLAALLVASAASGI